jgi:hypothetical protein
MKAKEMFEKLGYKEKKLIDESLVAWYEKNVFKDKQCIYFYPEKEIRITLEDNNNRVYPPIFNLKELQAINKQVEELGWNNER